MSTTCAGYSPDICSITTPAGRTSPRPAHTGSSWRLSTRDLADHLIGRGGHCSRTRLRGVRIHPAEVTGMHVPRRSRSAGLSSDDDRRLVGAGTARAEKYKPACRWEPLAEFRAGRSATPPIAVVSRVLDLDLESPLFTQASVDARMIVITCAAAPDSVRTAEAQVADVIVAGGGGGRPEGGGGCAGRPGLAPGDLRGRLASARPNGGGRPARRAVPHGRPDAGRPRASPRIMMGSPVPRTVDDACPRPGSGRLPVLPLRHGEVIIGNRSRQKLWRALSAAYI